MITINYIIILIFSLIIVLAASIGGLLTDDYTDDYADDYADCPTGKSKKRVRFSKQRHERHYNVNTHNIIRDVTGEVITPATEK